MHWHHFNYKKTIGKRGAEEGIIVSDVEYNHAARITIEQDGITAPFSVTVGIYDVMMHTDFFSTYTQAQSYQERIMKNIERIVALLEVYETDRDAQWQQSLNEEINHIIQ
ncbi:hypothetical protein [Capnocytophaga catalasegens]|uniref:Uncharacterized protein n=1 Tax=Capnocytophaga catalasegens TaxID=1004260 RepID=A0AAV5AWX5_9FLAO|nr:hypothetical protein [Capnocytophaga catalasegens]GIZ15824.1 hypothetical protein RCZ03_18240 [Capnocytophaga catalasegens]GJM49836.1 hypothetical protein RCZ15_08110 [Capnocytophaga catalasegens]GJM53001.1 hypothetical protein RCZ16_13180 [Capnocytophaga catalasegens]